MGEWGNEMEKRSVGFVIFNFHISIAPVYWSVNGSSRSSPSHGRTFKLSFFLSPLLRFSLFVLQGIISSSTFCLAVWILPLNRTFR